MAVFINIIKFHKQFYKFTNLASALTNKIEVTGINIINKQIKKKYLKN